MPLSTGQVFNNRYRIVSLLGQGGMGAVYRAWDISLKRPLALKENLETSVEAQKQFEREARILANLSHPNLPRVTDYFSIQGQGQYLVMDFVEGEDLQSMLDRQGALPEAQALEWVAQICDALDYLHNQPSPVIHRDIKPANIKITPDGRAVLVDFGIAKLYDPHRATTVGAKAVTPGFSPPEQYSGKTDARSDIYALGATLYFMLTGRVPPESIARATGGAMLPPHQINPGISSHTETAVLQAMALLPEQRFQNIGDFKAALTASGLHYPTEKYISPTFPVASSSHAPAYQESLQPAIPGEFAAPPAQAAPRVQSPYRGMVVALIAAMVALLLLLGGGSWYLKNLSATPSASQRATQTAVAISQRRTATALEGRNRATRTATVGRASATQDAFITQTAVRFAATQTQLARLTSQAEDIPTDSVQATAQWYTSQPVTWSIPFLSAAVKKVRFFEQGSDDISYGERTYSEAFEKSATRRICMELHLSHPAPGRKTYVTFDNVLFQPDGRYTIWDNESWVEEAGTTSYHRPGCFGSSSGGSWQVGEYVWYVFVGNQKIATGSLEIYP